MTQAGTLQPAPAAAMKHHITFVTDLYCHTSTFQNDVTSLDSTIDTSNIIGKWTVFFFLTVMYFFHPFFFIGIIHICPGIYGSGFS